MQMIAAVDRAWGIGKDKDLLVSISSDQKRFRQLTTGKTVVYGRRTLESFPGAKPLPGRRNIILSRSLETDGSFEVVRNFRELAEILANVEGEPLLIGGANLYQRLEPFCLSAELTTIDHVFPEAEHFFPNLDQNVHWRVTHESAWFLEAKHLLSFCYRRYERSGARPLAEIAALDETENR